MTCLFCDIPKERIIAMNDLAYAIRDGFPVSKLHTLIIPKRHAIDYFELTKDELLAIHDLIHQLKSFIQEEDPATRTTCPDFSFFATFSTSRRNFDASLTKSF
jgi:diadenosine tetraphosphate (Ap4A) HIT family hydrolase